MLAKRIQCISASQTLKITARAKELAKEGKDVVSFAAGEPDFDTPDFIKEKAIQAIKDGFTKYTPSSGTPDLKKAIIDKFKTDNNLDYGPKQIIVSCGAKHSIYNVIQVLVDEGQEVVIPKPFWVSYPEMVKLSGAKPVFVDTKKENSFKMTAAEFSGAITHKTKAVIINSPSNPCGCVYKENELKAIADICVEKGIYVISDEIYEKLMYDGVKHFSIASFGKEIYDLTITVNGLSKSVSMTGWRIGYLGAPLAIAEAIEKLQDHSTSNPCSISQKAALAAFEIDKSVIENMRAQFQERRNYVAQRLDKIKKLSYIKPEGAFYCFINISKTNLRSVDFAAKILDEYNVALIPGDSFGMDDYVRISFATSLKQIEKGLDRIEKFIG